MSKAARRPAAPENRDYMWCLPQVDARMEDVLDLFAEPPDPLARIKLAGARLAAL